MSNTPNLSYHRKQLVFIGSLRNRGGGNAVNECGKPSLGASPSDLAEFQTERLRSRRHRQLARVPGFTPKPRKSRLSDIFLDAKKQHYETLPNGGYRTYHPTKGWRIVSPKRLKFFTRFAA